MRVVPGCGPRDLDFGVGLVGLYGAITRKGVTDIDDVRVLVE